MKCFAKYKLEQGGGLPEKYDVVTCKTCGFCFANTTATLADYDNYYTNCNNYGTSPKEYEARVQFEKIRIQDISFYASKSDVIADIGAGRGSFLRLLSDEGYTNLIGVDPSKEACEQLSKIPNVSPFLESAYDMQALPLLNFATFNMVFEHLLCPDKAVASVYDSLCDGGYVLVYVPDCSALLYDKTPIANNFNHEHINYFSEYSLDNLFCPRGFEKLFSRHIRLGVFGNMQYSVYVVYQKIKVRKKSLFVKDFQTSKAIQEYVQRSLVATKESNRKIENLFASNGDVFIWGTGNYVSQLWETTCLKNCSIKAFVDNNIKRIGQTLHGIRIISPEDLLNQSNESCVIVICSMLFSEAIKKQIVDMGIKGDVVVV